MEEQIGKRKLQPRLSMSYTGAQRSREPICLSTFWRGSKNGATNAEINTRFAWKHLPVSLILNIGHR